MCGLYKGFKSTQTVQHTSVIGDQNIFLNDGIIIIFINKNILLLLYNDQNKQWKIWSNELLLFAFVAVQLSLFLLLIYSRYVSRMSTMLRHLL